MNESRFLPRRHRTKPVVNARSHAPSSRGERMRCQAISSPAIIAIMVLSCVAAFANPALGHASPTTRLSAAGTPPDGVSWSGGAGGVAKVADVMAMLTVANVNPKVNTKTSIGDCTEIDFTLPTGNEGIIWIGKREAIDWQSDLRTVGGRPVVPDVANVEWVWGSGWRALTRYGTSVAMSVRGYRGAYETGSSSPRSAHPTLPTMWRKIDEQSAGSTGMARRRPSMMMRRGTPRSSSATSRP